jgi:hypothetical protein
MPHINGDLFLFEAIELRKEYERHIKMLEQVLGNADTKKDRLFLRNEEEEKTASQDFHVDIIEDKLKKLQTKRVKLNQAIQAANFTCLIDFAGDMISLAETLELRKNLLADLDALAQRVNQSAYKRIIHKEGRDIIHEPRHLFTQTYQDYHTALKRFRELVTSIHRANHLATVKFKDE